MCSHSDSGKIVEAIALRCHCCSKDFAICKSCYRNDRYCSDECSVHVAIIKQQQSQSKYAKSKKGRDNQKLRDSRYLGKKKIKQKNIILLLLIPFDYTLKNALTLMHWS